MTELPVGYVFDTNIIIDGRMRSYPPELFPRLWELVAVLIADGRIICPREVLFELEQGDDDCAAWAKSLPNFVVEPGPDAVHVVNQITQSHPKWSSERSNRADPWVIAEAESRGFTVVTQERRSRSSVPGREKIPNVCSRRNFACITFVRMMQTEGWRF